MSQTNSAQMNTTNLLVPSTASTHCVKTGFTASVVPETINFGQFSNDNYPFNPQAAYFDNTAGTQPLVMTVQGLGFTVTVPAGQLVAANFPSPANLQVSVIGDGAVNIFWCDYPLFSIAPGNVDQVSIAGGQVGITGAMPVDKSVDTVSGVSTSLLGVNLSRKYLLIQAPQSEGVWLNMAGGAAAANGSGCVFLSSASIYESSNIVNQNAINYYCAAAGAELVCLEG